jgi:hypothetical protein
MKKDHIREALCIETTRACSLEREVKHLKEENASIQEELEGYWLTDSHHNDTFDLIQNELKDTYALIANFSDHIYSDIGFVPLHRSVHAAKQGILNALVLARDAIAVSEQNATAHAIEGAVKEDFASLTGDVNEANEIDELNEQVDDLTECVEELRVLIEELTVRVDDVELINRSTY